MNLSNLEVFLGTILSCIGLYLGYKRFRLKTGIKLIGTYTKTSSVNCADPFISRIMIENLKDRAITVYAIYLKISHNYYIKLEDFEDSPLIIKGFETYQKEFDPIDFYSVNMRRIRMRSLLEDNKLKQRLVISTSQGRYTVKSYISIWDPVHDWFKNHCVITVNPLRSKFKGKSYGSSIQYLVEFKDKDGKGSVVAIHPRDFRLKKFRNFQLTEESLESKDKLLGFFATLQKEGTILADSIEVHDMKDFREKIYQDYKEEIIDAEKIGWFRYRIKGRFYTLLNDRRIRRENSKRARK
jgi:hypothetical protein